MLAIPFIPDFKGPLERDETTESWRTRRYGNPGQWFQAHGMVFVLEEVSLITAGEMKEHHWKPAGTTSPSHYQKVWERVMRQPFNPRRTGYLHRFRRVPGMTPEQFDNGGE